MTVKLTKDNASYTSGAFTSTNGVWNAGPLVNGVGYTQTITIDENTFPDGLTMSWSWPEAGNGSVYAYPEVSWGGDGHVVQIADLISFDATYDFKLSGNLSGFNVAFEAWLYPDARGIWETSTSEVMLWVHSNGWRPQFEGTYTDGAFTANLEIDPNWGDLSGESSRHWQYVAAIPNQDRLSGTVSYSNLLKDLIWRGVLSGYEYMRTIEVGAETMQGKGTLRIDNLDYGETRKSVATGTAGDDTFTARPVGQNHVVAGGGTDTVVYSGNYADYELQARTQDVLVRARGDVASLDMLESVEKVRFADGLYDVATHSFTGSAPGGAQTTATLSPTSGAAVTVTGAVTDGTAAADTLVGTGGGDYIRGFDGADRIDGGAGDDDVNGNVGSDTVYGSDGADWVRGGKDNDLIDGGAGDDPHVNGNLGDDTVRGGVGNDTVYGGQGDDKVYGDAGDDLISGDLGNDLLTGGSGADRFAFAKGGGVDWVADFRASEGDRIQLPVGTAYTVTSFAGQVVIDLGDGDRLALAGVGSVSGDWLVFA